MIVLKLLSTHAAGEQTLDLPNQFLQVSCGKAWCGGFEAVSTGAVMRLP